MPTTPPSTQEAYIALMRLVLYCQALREHEPKMPDLDTALVPMDSRTAEEWLKYDPRAEKQFRTLFEYLQSTGSGIQLWEIRHREGSA